MKRSSFIALLVVIGFAGGVWVYSHRATVHERDTLASQQARVASLRTQLERLQRERDAAGRAAAEIARELQQAAVAASGVGAKDKAQTQPWLEKVKRLRGLFEQRPDQSSPELTLLTELDWLELAQTIPAGDDDRQARFLVRDFANERFFTLLRMAVRDHAIRTGGAPLTDPMQLQPFFRPPIDPAILARYEIASDITRPAPAFSLVARGPVDLDYDVRRSLSLLGKGAVSLMSVTWGSYPPWKASLEARAAYQAANGKPSTKTSDLLPYATDPTSRAIFETWIGYQTAHDGKFSSAPADLLPYATSPAARSLFESMARAEANYRVLKERSRDQ